ncbi:MAG: hypothetical protein ACI9QC_000035 [Oceanicoccus sp.]|jgi:hypothetical protein
MNKKLLIGGAAVAVLLGGAYVFGSGSLMQGSFGGWSSGLSDLELTIDASTPSSDILVLDQENQEVAVFKLTSDTDDYIVEDMDLSIKADVANNISAAHLEYENSDGDLETKTGYFLSSGVASFSGLDVFVAGADDAKVTVYVDLSGVADGATPGDRFAVTLKATDAVNQNTGDTGRATSVAAVGEIMQVFESKPTLALSSTSPSGARTVSSSDEVFVFNVSAHDSEDVDLVILTVDFASDGDFNLAADGDTVYLKNGGTTVATGLLVVSDADEAHVRLIPSSSFAVSGGDTESLSIVLDTTSLMDVDAGEDDMLTATIDLGHFSPTGTSKTGFLWNDTNIDAHWVGDVSNSNFSSNTLVY